MKTLVVYYSLSGTTRTCAHVVAKELHADTAEIRTKREINTKNMLPAAWMQLFRRATLQPLEVNPRDYDLVVLAAPVWMGKVAQPLASWLKSVSLMQKPVALMLTCGGMEGSALSSLAERITGARVIGSIAISDKDRKQAEIEQEARMWADELRETLSGETTE